MLERPKNATEVERDRDRLDNAKGIINELDQRIAHARDALAVAEETVSALVASYDRMKEQYSKANIFEKEALEMQLKQRELSLLEEKGKLEEIRQTIKSMSNHREEGVLAIVDDEKDFKRHLN